MWFIGVEVEQETSAPPPEKNPGSAPEPLNLITNYFCLVAYTTLDWKPTLKKIINS